MNSGIHNNKQEGRGGVFEASYLELPQFNDREAEEGVIALAFADVDYFSSLVEAGVNGSWFVNAKARWLFEVFNRILVEPGIGEFTEFAIEEALTRLQSPDFETFEIVGYFREITGRYISPTYLARYIQRLMKAYQRRLMFESLYRQAGMLLDKQADIDRALSYAEGEVSTIRRISTPLELLSANELVEQTEAFYTERLENGINESDCIPYKLGALQKVTGGIRRKELTLISAPPKVGKTALTQRIAYELALEGKVVLYISIEMPRLKWMGRVLQQQTGISAERLETGAFSEWRNTVFSNLARLKNSKLYMIDERYSTTETIKRAIEHVKRVEGDLHAVFIDYAQLLKDRLPGTNDNDMAKYVAGELAALPGRYNTHVFAISNLNRDGNLYGTVFLEYGCDNWWVIENDKATQELAPEEKSGEAKILVKYQRYGNSGHPVPVYWNAPYTRFTDRNEVLPTPQTRYGAKYGN